MKAINLRTNFLINPIGIDLKRPLLQWNCDGGIKQTAYQIKAYNEDHTLIWDSRKVLSSSMNANYEGNNLISRTFVKWIVSVWDENNIEYSSDNEATFELGLSENSDWKAKWITGNYQINKKNRYPVDYFKKEFEVKSVKKARSYITACGLYVAKINGKRVGDFILAPGITDYRKRVQVQTYDIGPLLIEGRNVLEVELADGWYRGNVGAWGLRNQYGTETNFIAQLEITEKSGEVKTITTDESFQWSNDGSILFADNKDGEIVDSRKVVSYKNNAKVTQHDSLLACSNNVQVSEHESFVGKLIITPDGSKVLDFGQNIAGYISFSLKARLGDKVRLLFGEMLDHDGNFSQANFQLSKKDKVTPKQEVSYICHDSINIYKTQFAIFGFRYMKVETSVDFKVNDFTAHAVYSDLEVLGTFTSSNKLLNKFVENTIWSSKGNCAELPTDCPTRERHGWSGDAQIFTKSACYFFNFEPFAKKYVQDLMDWQNKKGTYPQIAPAGGVDFYMSSLNGSVGWSDAGVIIPYTLWKMYGDHQIIQTNYESMRRYAKFMISRVGKSGPLSKHIKLSKDSKKFLVNKGQAYGEWAEPTEVHKMSWTDIVAPQPEVSTAYTHYVMNLMVEIAQSLEMFADAKEYQMIADGTKIAYQELVKTEKFTLDTDRQAKLVRPLYFNLLENDQKEFAKNRLIKALDNFDWKLGTGFLSTPLIMYVLESINIEYAYKLIENEQMPGWLFMPKNGATTIWESWEGTSAHSGIASLNHYSKGAVIDWLFSEMCGIKVTGENKFILDPKPGGTFTFARASYQSIYGLINSEWKKDKDKTIYDFVVPSNCTAEINLQGEISQVVSAGHHRFEL